MLSRHTLTRATALLLILVAFAAPGLVTTVAAEEAAVVSADSISAQRSLIEADAALSDEQKKQALARIDEIKSLLDETGRLKNRTEDLLSRIRLAPEQLAKLRRDVTAAQLHLDPADLEPWTIPQLELVLNERQLTFGEMQNELADRDRELNGYLTLARNGGAELADLEKRLADLQAQRPDASAPETPERIATVDRLWYDSREQMLKARIAWAQLQQNNLNLLMELSQLARDVAASRVDAMNEHMAQFRNYVQERRRKEAVQATQAAREAASGAPAAIRAVQQKISQLAGEREKLIEREFALDSESERVGRINKDLKEDLERIQQIIDLGGATAQVSTLLQKRRAYTPSVKVLTQQAIQYQQKLSDAALRQLELDELLRTTRENVNQRIEELLAETAASEEETSALRAQARETWSRYRDAILDVWKVYTRYIGKLSSVEANTRALIDTADQYRLFIDDHLLWMPSTDLVPLDQTSRLVAGITWVIGPDNLLALYSDTLQTIQDHAPAFALWLIGLMIIVSLRGRALRTLRETAVKTQKVRTDSIHATFKALGATLLLIAPGSYLLIGAGVILGRQATAQEYTLVTAVALQNMGHTLLFLGSLRQLCRTDGLARVHLGWHPVLCDHLGRQAAWLISLAVPLAYFVSIGSASVPSAFVYLSAFVQTDQAGLLSIGRAAMIAIMVLLATAVYRIWRRNGPVMKAMEGSGERGKWASYHVLWFAPSILLPVGIALAALSGYFYTAAFITSKAGETLWFILWLVLAKDLVLRALYVAQRRLRFEEALRYREEMLVQRATEDGANPPVTEAGELPIEEDKINYGQLGDQVRQLVQLGYTIALLSGLWWIWKDVIPAFNFLGSVELPISTSKLVEGVTQDVPLTLGDMVAGLLLGGLALFAARNVPALLELTLLQRLPLTRASRYALTTMTQYVVAMLGLVITFKALGLQWSSIQWLVAALSVGLGFGLQEIVANFISGIILLFEQPIRVGDVVTVDNTTGTVSRIRIRATTIVNWERQELIIPNKSFITGQLINWTLSDTINRLIINVGVSYDADTRKAMEIMAQTAADHPKVVNDPPPRITFEGFGDNALSLVMRAYLNDIDVRLATTTELHQTILDRFREAGIEIAFPQRDIHLDTTTPLEIVLQRQQRRGKDSDGAEVLAS